MYLTHTVDTYTADIVYHTISKDKTYLNKMGDLKEQLEKWKQSRYREPMSMTRYKMSEGFEWGVQTFLKKHGIGRTRFSYGILFLPRADVEKAKSLLKKK